MLDGINKTLTPLLRGTMAAGMTRVLALSSTAVFDSTVLYRCHQSSVDGIRCQRGTWDADGDAGAVPQPHIQPRVPRLQQGFPA